MRNFKDIIKEKLKVSTNHSDGYTLRNFVEWHNNEKPWHTLTANDIRILDFTKSPKETWRMFDGLSSKISEFLLEHLDDKIELTEDINKYYKEITYTFYIDDILFVVLTVYNAHAKYPTFFDQYPNKSLVSEKLKVSTKSEIIFSWEDFINALYNYNDSSYWFEDLITNGEFIKLPETEILNTKYRVIFIQIDDVYFDKKQVEIGLRQSPFAITVKMIAHNFDELLEYLDVNKINEIYDIFCN